MNGLPSEKHYYLFNGDFVDRGSWSTEIALVLYAYKWLRPHGLLINRGNHETDDMNKVYGFEGECKAKYNERSVESSLSDEIMARGRANAFILVFSSCSRRVSRRCPWPP